MADLKPVYLVHGDDDVKIDAWRDRLVARAKSETGAALEMFSGDTLDGADLAQATRAMTLSMGRRYLLADGVDKFKDADVKEVAAAIAEMPPDTFMVLLAVGKVSKGSGPASAKLVKAVEKAGGEAHLCVAPTQAGFPKWISKSAADLGMSIDREGASLLLERIGPHQQRLMRELEKLATYCDGGKITVDDIEAVGSAEADPRAYLLADAIVTRDAQMALTISEELRSSGTDLMPILFALLRKLRDTRTAWAMVNAGRSAQETQAALKTAPWIAKRVMSEARQADGASLEAAIAELAELDYAIRGGADLDSWTALTLAVERMTGAAAAP